MLQNVLISPSDAPEGGLDAFVQRLVQLGMQVRRVYPYGVIAGCIPAERYREFEALPGVQQIKPEGVIRLPPPDSPIQ